MEDNKMINETIENLNEKFETQDVLVIGAGLLLIGGVIYSIKKGVPKKVASKIKTKLRKENVENVEIVEE
jgi:NADP-dependent 3-hydroxy acid dehydrogenase YdfG